MVNFRYGDHLVGEVQLCVDIPESSQTASRRNTINHFLYELESGLFGPTFELIMQFEDLTRHDISVKLQAEGKIKKRQLMWSSKLQAKSAGRVNIVRCRNVPKDMR